MKTELPTLDRAIERGVEFLDTQLERSGDGLWRDYIRGGKKKGSNVWVSAYMAAHLGQVPQAHALAASACRALLERRRPSGGWGYDEVLLEDCDSTAWVLLAAAETGTAVPRDLLLASLGFMLSHQRPNGGFVTYGPQGEVFFGEIAARQGWFEPQTCVTAAATSALLTYVDNDLPATQNAIAYLQAARGDDAVWTPYWWYGFSYATYHATRALARGGGITAADQIEDAVEQRALPGGGWASLDPQRVSVFATALASMTLLEVARPDLGIAAHHMLQRQRPDGSFEPTAELRVPGGRTEATLTMVDQGLMTTASAIAALHQIRIAARDGAAEKARTRSAVR